MFNFLDALQGTTQTADEEGEEHPQQATSSERSEATSSTGLGLSSFWSVATAVTAAVKQTAGDVVRTVQETDWKSELEAFTAEVQTEATVVAEAVTHIPEHLQHAAEKAPAVGSPKAAAAGALGVLGTLGASLLEKTQGVLEQVTDLVEHELETAATEVERMTAGKPARSERLVARQQAQAKYSRFEAEVAAMQRDSSTYCDEPSDAEDFGAWRQGFDLAAAKPDIERTTSSNAFMSELQARIVPILVEYEDFWLRYFYKLHKLQQREDQRQQLAARAKMQEEQEEPGWEDEDGDVDPPMLAAASSGVTVAATAAAAVEQGVAGSSSGGGATRQEDTVEHGSKASGDTGSIDQAACSSAVDEGAAQEQAAVAARGASAPCSGPGPGCTGVDDSIEPAVGSGEGPPPAADAEEAAVALPGQEAAAGQLRASAQPAAAGAAGTGELVAQVEKATTAAAATTCTAETAAAAAAAAAVRSPPSSERGSGAGGGPSSPEAHTESDGSSGQRDWCVVTSPRTSTTGGARHDDSSGTARGAGEPTAGQAEVPKAGPAAALPVLPRPPTAAAAAAAAAAATTGDDEDEDWGCTDDAGGPAAAAATRPGHETGTPGQDDWDDWD